MKFQPHLLLTIALASTVAQANTVLDEVCLEEARKDYLEVNQSSNRVTRYLQGIEVTDFEETFNVAYRSLNGLYRDPELYADCETAICVMARFANDEEIALRTASIYARDGYNLKFRNDNPARGSSDFIWSRKTLRSIQNALDLLPTKFRPSKTAFQYFHSIEGNTNYFHQGARIISLNSKATTGVVLHEMGHATSMANFFSDIFSFRIFRGENKRMSYSQAYYADRAESSSAGFNPSKEEDYANSYAYYVMDGADMKVRAPNRFEFMKEKLFNGEELSNANVDELNKIFTPEVKSELFISCFEDIERIGRYIMAGSNLHWQSMSDTQNNISCLQKQISKLRPLLQSKRLQRLYCFEGGDKGVNDLMWPHFKPLFSKILMEYQPRLKQMSIHERLAYYQNLMTDAVFNGFTPSQKEDLAQSLANKLHL